VSSVPDGRPGVARRWLAARRGRAGALLAGLLVALLGLGAIRAQQAFAAMDARLGADAIVTPAGVTPTGGAGILLVDKPRREGLPRELVGRLAAAPGVAGVVPLYNVGRLSGQECPA
jgi:hypothetical protein